MLVKVPEAKSPPVHVYGIGPGTAAIADPVGSASAAATARDPRILRRIGFSMSIYPLSPLPRGHATPSSHSRADGAGSVSPLAQRDGLGDRIGPPRWWTHPPRSP